MRHDAGGRLLLYGVRVNGVLIIDMHLSYFSPLDLVNILASVVKISACGTCLYSCESTVSVEVGFTQSGSKVSIVLMNYPSDPPDTGTVDMSGKVTLGFKLSMKEKALRSGSQFYVDVTGTFVLDRSPDGTRLTGTGSYENLLREGSATAQVYATCSRTSTIELTRPGGLVDDGS